MWEIVGRVLRIIVPVAIGFTIARIRNKRKWKKEAEEMIERQKKERDCDDWPY